MNASLNNMCELFIDNRDRIKKEFRWQSNYIYPVCAAIFTDQKQLVDVERLLFCDRMLKNHTGIFSNFRGTSKLAMVSLLAVSTDPEQKMQKALQAYDMLKNHFFTSTFLPIAAVIMADMVEPDRYMQIAQNMQAEKDLRFNENLAMQTTAISSTVSLIVAQQAAICAAVAASSAAAASSSS